MDEKDIFGGENKENNEFDEKKADSISEEAEEAVFYEADGSDENDVGDMLFENDAQPENEDTDGLNEEISAPDEIDDFEILVDFNAPEVSNIELDEGVNEAEVFETQSEVLDDDLIIVPSKKETSEPESPLETPAFRDYEFYSSEAEESFANSENTGATRKFDTAGINSLEQNDGDIIVPVNYANSKMTAKQVWRNIRRVTKVILRILKNVFKVLAYALVTLLIVGILTGIFVGVYYVNYVKENFVEDYDIVGLQTDLKQTSKIYYIDENGKPVELVSERLHGTEDRAWVSLYDMPEELRYAFIAIEDQRFYEHNGMDVKRTLGAVMSFVGGDSSYGGSTITQQLIKNFSGDDDTTIQRKITEIFRAISLTEKRSKDEVLEMYLNTINLSNGCHGVQAAANYLFGKDVKDLTLVECASLAAIPKSPYQYNPKLYPEANEERRALVLEKMKELSDDGKLGNIKISDEEYKAALNAELVLNITEQTEQTETTEVYSYFTDALIEQLIEDFNREYGYPRSVATNIIFNGGLKIHATVDPAIQNILEETYLEDSTFYGPNERVPEGIKPQSAMTVIDPYTGEVKGLVGGRDEKTESRGLNRATMATRQVGSAIKPLTVYAPAVDRGYIGYASVIDDTPYTFNESLGKYWPENAGRPYLGYVNVNYAIAESLNTTAVKTLAKITPGFSYEFATKKLGLENLKESDIDYAPLALGGLTSGLTTLEMASAYTIFPNNGNRCAPRLYTVVYDNDGNILLENKPSSTKAISPESAQLMTKMLEGVVQRGTGTAVTLKNKVDVAGKTGSTNSNKDLYFVGYTPYYVAACWYGYDEPKVMNYNVNPAMRAWDVVMTRIHDEIVVPKAVTGVKEFPEDLLVKAKYCRDSGKLCTDLCTQYDPRGSREEDGWFVKSKIPREKCDVHVLVDFCGASNGVAGKNCLVRGDKVALVDISGRDYFIRDIKIVDSEYGYRKMPKGTSLAEATPELPYYSVLAPEEMFAGRPNVGYWRRPTAALPDGSVYYPYAFNRACSACDAAKEEIPPEPPAEDVTVKDDEPTGEGSTEDTEKEPEIKDEEHDGSEEDTRRPSFRDDVLNIEDKKNDDEEKDDGEENE